MTLNFLTAKPIWVLAFAMGLMSGLQAQGLRLGQRGPAIGALPPALEQLETRQADFIVAVVNSEPITNQEVVREMQRVQQMLMQQRQSMPAPQSWPRPYWTNLSTSARSYSWRATPA